MNYKTGLYISTLCMLLSWVIPLSQDTKDVDVVILNYINKNKVGLNKSFNEVKVKNKKKEIRLVIEKKKQEEKEEKKRLEQQIKARREKKREEREKELNRSRGVGRTINMIATAYDDSPQSQGKWVGTTATGVKPRVGVVAVDPSVIPLGTKLYVESLDSSKDYGYCVAGDTGGAIKGNRIDLFHNTRSECYNFGRRRVKVHILK